MHSKALYLTKSTQWWDSDPGLPDTKSICKASTWASEASSYWGGGLLRTLPWGSVYRNQGIGVWYLHALLPLSLSLALPHGIISPQTFGLPCVLQTSDKDHLPAMSQWSWYNVDALRRGISGSTLGPTQSLTKPRFPDSKPGPKFLYLILGRYFLPPYNI